MNKEMLLIKFNGKVVTSLNPLLVERQGISVKGVELLKSLHRDRLAIEEEMELTGSNDIIALRSLFDKWTKVQFALQKAWGFEQDKSKHPFWTVPCCVCPKIDNEENYLVPDIRDIDNGCPVHGKQ